MIKCNLCNGKSRVTDSRQVDQTIRRRRVCVDCGARWSTVEVQFVDMHDMVHREHLSLSEIALRVGKSERAVAIELSRMGVRAGFNVPNRRRPFAVPPDKVSEYRHLAKKGYRVLEIGKMLGLLPPDQP